MSRVGDSAPVVFTDADNTLWDTDGLFADAQLRLLTAVEAKVGRSIDTSRLDYVREVDQKLAERHHQGLRYPPRLLAIGVAYALQGDSIDQSVTRAWKEVALPSGLDETYLGTVENKFIADVRKKPTALPGVLDGLRELGSAGFQVFVLTEGDKSKVADRLAFIGAESLVQRVIEAPKNADTFRRVLRLVHSVDLAWMIGDQFTRDIQPAQEAGLRTIYIPSKFRPKWELKAAALAAGHTAADFGAASKLILRETDRVGRRITQS